MKSLKLSSTELDHRVEELVKRCNRLAMESLDSDNLDQALILLNKASYVLNHEMSRPPASLKAMTLNNLGCLFKRFGQTSKALEFLNEALEYEKGMANNKEPLISTHLNISAALKELKKHKQAKEHAIQAAAAMNPNNSNLEDKFGSSMQRIGLEIGKTRIFLNKTSQLAQNRTDKKVLRNCYGSPLNAQPRSKSKLQPLNSNSKSFANKTTGKPNSSRNLLKIVKHKAAFVKKPCRHKHKSVQRTRRTDFLDTKITLIDNKINSLKHRMERFEEECLPIKQVLEEEKCYSTDISPTEVLQVALRRKLCIDLVTRRKRALLVIQKWAKMLVIRNLFREIKRAAVFIQRCFRFYMYNYQKIMNKSTLNN